MIKIKGHKETFGDNGYVYYLDCGDGNTSVYNTYVKLTKVCILTMCSFCVLIILQ